ncbi:beta-ketoacyl synthase N-terminal-like domain-containing protein [Streptomyces sp. 7-21]|jgi:malonyl-ACP decarboxylase|uniref:beta-ketoacyl synthase N-terminal-like domain-containing protein n=1 Tax=Streptomyces sp. 7-21 TaxID=2802283 RepID=UPI00191E22D6|nr:beta-ketoacyl synthase N-terminal-like domain-containing protein [Streptomyces sp. 7-21]MBL1065932.1 3-oxoacyl-ACP synthase [Streptomyces sp. 7-21]
MVTITGMGIQCAVAHDVETFDAALRAGRHGFGFTEPAPGAPRALGFGARLAREPRDLLAERRAAGGPLNTRLASLGRRASRTIAASLLAAAEAHERAGLGAVADRRRVALVAAGNNISQELAFAMGEKYRKEPSYVSPRYAHQMWDSDLLGTVSEALEIKGEGMTAGGASASGNIGLIQGMRLIREGNADVCVVVAGMQELSAVELRAFAQLGALGGKRDDATAGTCCRPFDQAHDGFVFGEGAGAVVLESEASARARGARPLARVAEGVTALDGHHLTQPSQEGEEYVMREALARAGVDPAAVSLVSAHATATPLGDETEAAALAAVLGPAAKTAWVNATKSLTGHCLGAAGLVEAIACVLQLRGGYVHPNRNLTRPVSGALRFAPGQLTAAPLRFALNNSFGFGGINTTLLLQSADDRTPVRPGR